MANFSKESCSEYDIENDLLSELNKKSKLINQETKI